MIRKIQRILSLFFAAGLAATLGTVGATALAVAVPEAAHASTTTSTTASTATSTTASVVGGTISRSEVISRAVYWLDRGDTWYSEEQADAIPDGDGHTYRPDCSGFVSMTWHLPKKTDGWDLNTRDFLHEPSPAAPGYAGVSPVGLDDLRPGDAIIRTGHMDLFDRWIDPSDHSRGIWTYGEHDTGRKTEHDRMSWSYLSANFSGIRYNNIS